MSLKLTKKSFYELIDNREIGDGIFIIKSDNDTLTFIQFSKCRDNKLRTIVGDLLRDIIKEYENET